MGLLVIKRCKHFDLRGQQKSLDMKLMDVTNHFLILF